MPILYACVVNRRKEIVLDGQDKRFKSNYKELVLDNYRLFEPGKSKAFELGESFQLHYRHEGTWVIAIISQKPDVTLYEAMNFIDRFRAVIMPDEETGDGDIQAESAEEHFARHKGQVSDLIYKWNSDPSNRDRTYQVFQELLQTKEEMIKNMHLLNDRDQLLEVGLVKAQGLEKTTKLYKINAKKQKNKMITRRCCLWFGSITGIIVLAVGAFLLLWLVFGVIKL